VAEQQNPRKGGEKQAWFIKLLVGAGCFVLLLALIWSPLFLLSSANPTLEPNYVTTASVRVLTSLYYLPLQFSFSLQCSPK